MDNLGMYARPSDLTGCISACKPTSLGMGTRCPHQTSPLHSKNSMGCAEDVLRKEYTERSLEIPRRTFSLSLQYCSALGLWAAETFRAPGN